MFDFLKEGAGALAQGFSDVGGFAADQAKKLKPGKRVGDEGTEVFGNIDEFTQPQVLNKVEVPESEFNFSGMGDTRRAFDGYFMPGSLKNPEQYTNIGDSTWKDDGSGGWGTATAGEKGVDWRTSEQARAADEKMNFIPDTYEGAKEEWGEGFDWEGLARTLQSVKVPTDQPGPSSSGRAGGRFNFDKSLYENPLLTREYQALYQAPLYTKPY